MTDIIEQNNQASNASQKSGDDLSIEECERLVLSPPPVPMDLHVACDAINAAARRSNSSRTHSIQTQPTDGWGDGTSHPSNTDLRISTRDHKPIFGRNFQPGSWTRLLCCFSARTSIKLENSKPKTKGRRNQPSLTNHLDSTNSASNGTTDSTKRIKLWPFRRTAMKAPKNGASLPPCDKDFIPDGDWPQSGIPSSDSENQQTIPIFHPALPASVLNALSSATSSFPSTSHNLSDSLAPVNGTSAVSPSNKSMGPMSCQRIPGFKLSNTNPEAMRLPLESDATNYSGLDSHNAFLHTNHTARSWVGGDIADHTPVYEFPDAYHIDVDENGAQGDSSSENMEGLTPGMDLLGDVPADCANKKCLVLDLDETLVHSWFKYVDNASFIVPVELDGIKHQIYVCTRPHLDEFLRAVGPLFECVMFTASLRKYADPVCDYIDQVSCFRHRLFREACVYHQNNLIKDLTRLGRDVDQICILDNSPVSFLFQPQNALQIVSWYDDPHDRALLDLIPYFQGLARSNNVVDYLREFRPPSSAAVAQPPTPSWFFLFDASHPNDLDESDGADHLEDVGYEYTEEEEAVLSPHFHPPVPSHSSTASALVRSYLTQLDPPPPASRPVPSRISVNKPRPGKNSLIVQLPNPNLPVSDATDRPMDSSQ